jgi:hypothetical protein
MRKWNKLNENTQASSLVLKFKIDVEEEEDVTGTGGGGALLMAAIQPSKTRFLNELNSKVKTKFGFVLNEEFLLKWCGLYGWDEITLVSLINHVLEEARQVREIYLCLCLTLSIHLLFSHRSSRRPHLTVRRPIETLPLRGKLFPVNSQTETSWTSSHKTSTSLCSFFTLLLIPPSPPLATPTNTWCLCRRGSSG